MASLKINASSLWTHHSLKLGRHGVYFRESAVFSLSRFYAYQDIECVLLSAEGRLSFQADGNVCSIQIRRGQRRHMAVIEALVERLNQTVQRSPASD